MASISDAQAAFDAYHAAVSAKISELEAQGASSDASSLVDAINAAKDEVAPQASVTAIGGEQEDAAEEGAETQAQEQAEEPQGELVNDPEQDSAR